MEEGAALSCTPGRLLLVKVSIVSLLCKTYGDDVSELVYPMHRDTII